MKKVLTILVVLTVIAGFAFADAPAAVESEQHKLTVTAKVIGQAPVFQLFKDTVVTNDGENPVEFTDGESYEDAFNAAFNLDAGGAITVSARVANLAKEVQVYTLTFSDGEFAVTKNGGDATIVPTIAATPAQGAITGVAVQQGTTDAQVKASFNGTKMTAASTLATATYTYAADSAIDPGTYTADIVLTVAAV